MDRALDLGTLTAALGTHARLPAPSDLQRLLAATEIGLFTRQAEIDEALIDAAWYLQSVATVRADLQLFTTDRRRLAHQVSAHIFDLALQATSLSPSEQLRYTFAAQVGYLGGELTPNASALARRAPLSQPPYEWTERGVVSMDAGIQLLALNRPAIYPLLQARLQQLDDLSDRQGDLSATLFAAVNGVVRGIWELTNFLTYGRAETLDRAEEWFRRALQSEHSASDVDSRWVAAHLLEAAQGLRHASVWSVLPPNLPSAARAMTLGDPPVLLLWPPQVSFLEPGTGGVSPLDPSAKRLVLSFPTSAGKSLLAQLFVIAHLVSGAGDVCVVAPTHSLCRELALGLERRLRTLGYRLYEDGPLGLFQTKPPAARVVVMTPEKLAARLRSDPAALLAEFGMFVVDEAHLVGDRERGWRLEQTISFLNYLTRNTQHRLLVLSAALGNQVHIVAWIDNGSGVVSKHEDWRGPRRLNVVFTTEADWPNSQNQSAHGARRPRQYVPLKGVLHLRTPAGASAGNPHGLPDGAYPLLQPTSVRAVFTEPVGTLVRRARRDGTWVRDGQGSTSESAQIVPLIAHVATTGPVLVVEATRTEAQRLAEEVADKLTDDHVGPFALIDVVRSRLGPDHPLTKVLRKGVAFHHSALPIDIQTEIEDAVRSGYISCLVATTTLTEGVNLPFKTVIVAHRGYWGPDGLVQLIDAPRLLNAIGRAGRAGRETEGWLVLVEHSQFEAEMFADLERTGKELEVHSTLASEAALEALAQVEAVAHAGADAVFSNSGAIADGFISYVWFVADALEDLQGRLTRDGVRDAVRATLAWQQLDDAPRNQLQRVADIAFDAFVLQPADRRRRWARSGTSLSSAAVLDSVAEEVLKACLTQPEVEGLSDSLSLILADGRLETLLGLAENERRGFKLRRNAPRDQLLAVDLAPLVHGWVSGAELQALADRYLAAVENQDYRYEQMAEFTAKVFEHHLPWTLGIVIAWVNRGLEMLGNTARLPAELPGAVHFGVGTSDGLALMLGGVRSRRLANRVADVRRQAARPHDDQPLREWLADQDIAAWRQQFDASPTELLDLLAYARAPEARLVSEVFEGNGFKLPLVTRVAVSDGAEARIEPEPGQPAPAPLAVIVDGRVVGTIAPEHHEDVALLTDIGIPLSAHVEIAGGQFRLDLRLKAEPS